MAEPKDVGSTENASENGVTLSRRQALTVAALLATGAGLGSAAAAPSNAGGNAVGFAPAPENAVEFRARFAQTGSSGEVFTAYGYITRADGAKDAELFNGAPQNETTALLTAYAEGTLVKRVLDQSVHSLDIDGTLTVYQRPAPGASFGSPDSFKVGVPVAQFDLALQDVLSVLLPGKGIPTLTGAMEQTLAAPLAGSNSSRRFGRIGSKARFFATGIGTLVDPITLNANLEMAGNWLIE